MSSPLNDRNLPIHLHAAWSLTGGARRPILRFLDVEECQLVAAIC